MWAFERQAGAWGIRLTDRLFRFVGFSAVMHALLAPLTYWLWVCFVRSGALGSGEAPLGLWLVEAVEVDPQTGAFVLDEEGNPVPRGSAILIRWDEVEYLDFTEV